MTNDIEIIDADDRTLGDLAELINVCVLAAETSARSALGRALEAGQFLNQAKAKVQHGQWNDWLEANCSVAPRTARSYMRLAVQYAGLSDPKRQRVADLPLRDAIKAISTDPTPPEPGHPAVVPKDNEGRNRVVTQFESAARSMRDAAKWFGYNMDLKPQKVATLRKKLTEALAELDRMQNGGAQ